MTRAQALSNPLQLQTKGRTVWVFVSFAVVYFLLAGRLAYLQVVRHAYFEKQEYASLRNESILPAKRGLILDRNGEPLAVNVPASHVFADPMEVNSDAAALPGIVAVLSPLIGRDPAVVMRELTRNPKSHYISLLRHADVSVGDAVAKAKLPGIHVEMDSKRAYPNGPLAAQVLGFTNGDLCGVEGVEHSQDAHLEGTDGVMVGEVDQKGRFLPGTIRQSTEPVNGQDVTLTIDKTLQGAADATLAADVRAHHAERGVVVILDPKTGEILALSTQPGYDPNLPRPTKACTPQQVADRLAAWRDSPVSDLYEPGSTLKTITACAVLQEEGLQAMNRHVYCNGTLQVGDHIIHCAKDPPYYGVHGREDLRGILKESCNVGMAQFGLALGAKRLYKYEQLFGFLDAPQSGLPGEAKSQLRSPYEFNHFTGSMGWSKIQLANISFGQGISVTPLQLAAAYAAIANGGVLMRPHIVLAYGSGATRNDVRPVAIRRVVDPQVAAAVRSMLGTVVQEGTGQPAQVAGFTVGGKTGSAQVAGPRGYVDGEYVSSFIGMAPLSNPRVVILCAVFQPQGVHWGAAVAAPVVHDLIKRAMLEMHQTPDDPSAPDWQDHLSKAKEHVAVTTIAQL